MGYLKDKRLSKDEYYLNIAKTVALRGTCLRRNYGAIIVNNDAQVSAGYTGSPRGFPNCCDLGSCLRNEYNIPSGERYDICRSVHAEENAVINAARTGAEINGAKIYVAGIDKDGNEVGAIPCKRCKKVIINSGIEEIIMRDSAGKIYREYTNNWKRDAEINPDMLVEVPKKDQTQK